MTPSEFFDKARGWLDNLEEAFDNVAQKARDAAAAQANSEGQFDAEEGVGKSESDAASSEDTTDEASFAPPHGPTEAATTDIEGRVPALAITYGAADTAPTNGLPPTRFGGQPDWLATAQWPVSRTQGEPMEFVAQLALHPDDLPWLDEPKMAYLFITNDEHDPGGIEVWEPFGGDNAVIIQPGDAPSWVDTLPSATGPSAQPAVAVQLTPRSDPLLRTDQPHPWPDSYYDAISYDKIGGTPNFFQGLEFPDFATGLTTRDPSAANPILQLIDADAAWVNLGDAGHGVAFLSPNQRQGAYLWFN